MAEQPKTAAELPKHTPVEPGSPVTPGSKPGPELELALKTAPEKSTTRVEQPPPPPELPVTAPGLPFHIPPILFEGDEPSPAKPTPRKRAVPSMPEGDLAEPGSLPEAYGTGELVLRARDPHWLYAHWDLSREHQRRYNALSADGRLALRIYRDQVSGTPVEELRVHPESQHWFVHVRNAGVQYVAELGYCRPDGVWVAVSESAPVSTPREGPSTETELRFAQVISPAQVVPRPPSKPVGAEPDQVAPSAKAAAVPAGEAKAGLESTPTVSGQYAGDAPLRQEAVAVSPVAPPKTEMEPGEPATGPGAQPQSRPAAADVQTFAPVPERKPESARTEFLPHVPTPAEPEMPVIFDQPPRVIPSNTPVTLGLAIETWNEQEERQLLDLAIGGAPAQAFGLSSEQAAAAEKRARAQGAVEITSPGIAGPVSEQAEAISSPVLVPAAAQPGPNFWFQVNAELVIYGATEPNASVSISGRHIRLRPDGSFSYRFSLPDGSYALDVRAESRHGDTRSALLQFGRQTAHRGEVGSHPQDPLLKPPTPESLP